MESEKVKEVKKIATSCADKNKAHCTDCQKGGETDIVLTCRSLLKDTLTLIDDLESENEWLSAKYRNLEINYNDAWEQYREYEVENRQLKDRIAELENQMCRNEDLHTATEKLNDMIILKHFAERLKEKAVDYYTKGIIDETLKEFIR